MNNADRFKPTASLPIVGRQPPPKNKRPQCFGCGVRLQPTLHSQGYPPTHRTWFGATDDKDGYYDGYGHFHSLTCAQRWANRVVNSGAIDKGMMERLRRKA